MIHVCPRELLKYIEVSPGDETVDVEDLVDPRWVDEVESALARGEVTVWASFLASEIGPFTKVFLSRGARLSVACWIGVILHGDVRFQVHGMISALRLIASRSGRVGARLAITDKIGREVETMKAYYADLLSKHKITMSGVAVDTEADTQATSLHPAVAALARPIFEDKGPIIRENDFARPYWNPWEREYVHGRTRANLCGLPFFLNPSSTILLANLIDHFRPATVVEIGSYKYGGTALLLLLTEWLGCKVITVNPPGLDDDPWWNKLTSKPWASRVARQRWNDANFEVHLEGQGPVLALFNWHFRNGLVALTNQVMVAYSRGILVYHGDSHMETPLFLKELSARPEIRRIESIYEPEGGTWCSSGLFEFDTVRIAHGSPAAAS